MAGKGNFDNEIKSSMKQKAPAGKGPPSPSKGKFTAGKADETGAKKPFPQGKPPGAAPPHDAAMPMPMPTSQPAAPVSQSDPMMHAAGIAHAILQHGRGGMM